VCAAQRKIKQDIEGAQKVLQTAQGHLKALEAAGGADGQ
jgi:hypothetical protein